MEPIGVLVCVLCCIVVGAQPSDNKCENPKLEHGRLFPWLFSDLSINTAIRYRCDEGYVAANQVSKSYGSAKCTNTGWDPEPKCLGPCSTSKEDMNANGIRTGFVFLWTRSPIEHGDSILFRCVPGYGISDPSLLRVQCNDGVIPYPKCTKLEGCGPPPIVLHGETVQDRVKSYEHGSVMTYKCPLSYTLEGNQNITCRNGKWDDLPACKGPCRLSEEEMEANGIRGGLFLWWRQSTLHHGDRVSFRCVRGYDISDFKLLRVQCDNGVIPYPKCSKPESCGPPPVVPHGETVQDRVKSYEHGSVMTYKCPQYYALEGNQNVTCRSGKWDDPPACREPCVVNSKDVEENNIRLLWLGTEKQYVQHGDYIRFRCLRGYGIPDYNMLTVKCHQGIVAYPKCTAQE
ncbi:hypothetical protein XENTR_v10022567 [Xenopus tropicalis]|uniref:Coagulation factor XIII B chain isoform X2 n=1 Tax=Xenopus tropicalis TaxID=8364 RepID=A0A8J0QRK3_XENTR|nr:coagulation factor XIII B chain isoform X2 [Xenopus tropicalis]KAE8588486.1 hypothetical protein XENTR_v10022567 [Xenopus tropicalis]|eukprot:XP_002938382.2 PREDICTED: coagulation factor XIII B chain-like isoform X2 [Xenopus tropicalis]